MLNNIWRKNPAGKNIFIVSVAVAVVAAAKSPDPQSMWPNTLLPYFLAVGSAALGIFLWRSAGPLEPIAATAPGGGDLSQALQSLVTKLDSLEAMVRRRDLANFSIASEQVVHEEVRAAYHHLTALEQRFSKNQVADLSGLFAFGERYLHRAWSAASDGYEAETKKSLEIAMASFRDLAQKIA